MPYTHWFVSRQKRKLTTILLALIAYNDVCVGKVWNTDLQLVLEDTLSDREITEHGSLRARRAGQGGGGTRTLFKQMKDLGLVFLEDETRICRLTLIGEDLVLGKISFVEAMRIQLKRYQYPSAAVWRGAGSVDHSFKVHPFQFLFRLLRDPRLENTLTMDEMSGIVIHYATSDTTTVYESVVDRILRFRQQMESGYVRDTDKKTYGNIANTFFNYAELTQYVERGNRAIGIRRGKEIAVDEFIDASPAFISRPDLSENYIRAYGRGRSSKDLRSFSEDIRLTQRELNEARIRSEYIALTLKTPIESISSEVVHKVSSLTGIDEVFVERYLTKNYPHGNTDDFFLAYKELAHMGRAGARDFELATCEMFRKVFKMHAVHVGPIGNTPDVFVESDEFNFCGIIDNKAYKNSYSITGDHRRVMEDVYIPTYKQYGKTKYPLAFFTYIAESFSPRINYQLDTIIRDTGVKGSAMPVDILIDTAQDYLNSGRNHQYLRDLFSVNREVRISDIK